MKNNRLIYLLIILLTIWCVVLTSFYIDQKENSGTNSTTIIENKINGFSSDITETVEQVKANTVLVESTTSTMSGVIYGQRDNKVCVLTCYHGLSGSSIYRVVLDNGLEYEANLIGYDIYGDVALLEIDGDLMMPTLNLGSSSLLKDGEFLITLGTQKSKEYSNSVALMLVSSKLRTISNSITYSGKNYDYYTSVIQLNGNIANGYSGSAVYNLAGEMVGMITMKDDTTVFALPINEIKLIVNNILSDNPISKLQMGIKGEFIQEMENYEKNNLGISLEVNSGFYVINTKNYSLASNLGIKNGDIVLSINGNAMNTYSDLLYFEYEENKEFNITLIRQGEEMNLVGSIND